MQTNLAQLSITISDSKKYALHSILKAAFAFRLENSRTPRTSAYFFLEKEKTRKETSTWNTNETRLDLLGVIDARYRFPLRFFHRFTYRRADGSGARSGDGLIGGSRVAARKQWFVQPEATFTPVVGFVTVDATRDTRPR